MVVDLEFCHRLANLRNRISREYHQLPKELYGIFGDFVAKKIAEYLPEIAEQTQKEPAVYNFAYHFLRGCLSMAEDTALEANMSEDVVSFILTAELEMLLRAANFVGAEKLVEERDLQEEARELCLRLPDELAENERHLYSVSAGKYCDLKEEIGNFAKSLVVN